MSDRSNRLIQGCAHSVTVRVPCSECVEGRIDGLVRGAKHEGREQTKDEYKDTMANLQRSVGQFESLKGSMERLLEDKRVLIERINMDIAEIKRLKAQNADLAASLSAERTAGIVFNQPRDDEDEAN